MISLAIGCGFESPFFFLITVWRNPEKHSEWELEMEEPGRVKDWDTFLLPMTVKLDVKSAWAGEDKPEIEWE